MINFRHNLKSIQCGDCNLKYTIPAEHNNIHHEMRIHKKIIHGHKPQVIDKNTKDLRDMNEKELQEHLDRVKVIVNKQLQEEQKTIPHNKINVVEEISNGVLSHTFEIEPVYGIVESKLKDATEEGMIHSEIYVKCPKCGKIGMTIQNRRKITEKDKGIIP